MLQVMTIWTRITEVLSAVGDSVSEALARIVGAPRAKRDPQKSVAFTIGVIALSAKMAKADGVVTPAEVSAFKEIFVVRPDGTERRNLTTNNFPSRNPRWSPSGNWIIYETPANSYGDVNLNTGEAEVKHCMFLFSLHLFLLIKCDILFYVIGQQKIKK